MESGGDLKTTLLDKSPSGKDSSGARLYDIPVPRPTRSQYFWAYARRLAIMAIPVYTLEVVLLEVRGILEDKSDKWAEEQFVLNFINPFIFTMLFSVMIVDDLAFEYLYHRCLEYGLVPRFERKPAYTAQLVWLIGLLGFGSCGVIGYFVNPRQGGVIGLQALQLIVVYYSSFYREREVFPLSQLFGQSDTDFAQSQAMLQKFVPITERQLTALCVHKRRIYDKVRRGLCCPDENYVKKNFKAAAGDLYDFSSFQRRLAANPGLPNTCSAKCNPGNHLWAYNAMVTTELFTDAHDQQMSKFINLLMWLSLAFVLACQATTGVLFALLQRSGWDWDL